MALAAVLSFLRRLLVCPSAALPSASLSLSRAPSFFRSHRAPAPGCTFAFKLHAIHPHPLARSLGGGGRWGDPGRGAHRRHARTTRARPGGEVFSRASRSGARFGEKHGASHRGARARVGGWVRVRVRVIDCARGFPWRRARIARVRDGGTSRAMPFLIVFTSAPRMLPACPPATAIEVVCACLRVCVCTRLWEKRGEKGLRRGGIVVDGVGSGVKGCFLC